MRARDVMSAPVLTVGPDTPVTRAAELLVDKGYTALPVVDDDDRLIGIVTEADLLRGRFATDSRSRTGRRADPHLPTSVAEVMTTPAVAMSAGTDTGVLARVMVDDRRRCVPIVDGSRLVGVVTRRDLVRVLARSDEEVAADLRGRLAVLGGPSRWTVRVALGSAEITDRYDEPADRQVARVLAEAVPGVVRVNVHSEPESAV
ncbi:CBS domain-containing protein [Actinokineospora globicatena]|uniref:CBS domain-containing protein n=1 Tax=Actinokineospora globicatena TaxID=103729 RepID=UPI0020A47D24|nr:CBS domain-containing protein [Actinokineospora globicatena]MCP2306128.1 CBS domain-containing protein [Actinokineospora globicatena]GLW79997.1 CBS domain-containing protein [Actinokineospora globicatena]GLW86826.1 CBS domain-containing protein [Actinokineospora globicatena]